MFKRYIISSVSIFLISVSTNAGDTLRKSFGFTPLAASGIEEYDAMVFNEQLRGEIEKIGVYSTIPFSEVQLRLAEQDLPNSCTDLHCAVVAGQLLGVEYFGYGSIGKVGKAYTLSMTVVEVRTGKIAQNISEFFKGRRSAFTQKIIPRFAASVSGITTK